MTAQARYSPAQLAMLLGLPEPTGEQATVIAAPLEPLAVIAGAGSGKSETMAARLVWLVANGMVAPERVLGLTFTRKAAAELGQRVRTRLAGLRRVGLAGGTGPAAGPGQPVAGASQRGASPDGAPVGGAPLGASPGGASLSGASLSGAPLGRCVSGRCVSGSAPARWAAGRCGPGRAGRPRGRGHPGGRAGRVHLPRLRRPARRRPCAARGAGAVAAPHHPGGGVADRGPGGRRLQRAHGRDRPRPAMGDRGGARPRRRARRAPAHPGRCPPDRPVAGHRLPDPPRPGARAGQEDHRLPAHPGAAAADRGRLRAGQGRPGGDRLR